MSRRAKVVCTLGPATASPASVQELVCGGMDVARLNFSHGTQAGHQALLHNVRRAADAVQRTVGVLADLQGPKVRLGRFSAGPVELVAGATFVLTTERIIGTAQRASTTYADLPRDVCPGDTVLVDDGLVRLEVEAVNGNDVLTQVVEGGLIDDHKGINLPGVRVSAPAVTPKDVDDLRFALAMGVDLIALSFVRSPSDIDTARSVMDTVGRRVPVLAKIERPEAVERLDEIAEAFDGLLIARGDLGVELPLRDVPLIQKKAVQVARELGKPVIVATQMLESMIVNPRPTRAEVSDVANAVFDGADALMLSAETSAGRWPGTAMQTMVEIICAAERDGVQLDRPPRIMAVPEPGSAIVAAAVRLGRDLAARALVAFTETGRTARWLAAYRSELPLLAFTPKPEVQNQLSLSWGVDTLVSSALRTTDEMVAEVDRAMIGSGRGKADDTVVIVAGAPPGVPHNTNTIRVHTLGR